MQRRRRRGTCLDYGVDGQFSGLNWTAGCHWRTALLRFRLHMYSIISGDIGRTERQRQVVGKIINKSCPRALCSIHSRNASSSAAWPGVRHRGRRRLAHQMLKLPDSLFARQLDPTAERRATDRFLNHRG